MRAYEIIKENELEEDWKKNLAAGALALSTLASPNAAQAEQPGMATGSEWSEPASQAHSAGNFYNSSPQSLNSIKPFSYENATGKGFKHQDGATYKILAAGTPLSNPRIVVYLSQRTSGKSDAELKKIGLPKVSYTIHAFNRETFGGVDIPSKWKTEFTNFEEAREQYRKSASMPYNTDYELVPGSSEYYYSKILLNNEKK